MATICKLCNKKLGFFDGVSLLEGIICEDCYYEYSNVFDSISFPSEFEKNISAFKNKFSKSECTEEIVKRLTKIHEDYIQENSEEIKHQEEEARRQEEEAQRQKEEARQREAEEQKRKIEAERKAREERQKAHQAKMDNLNQMGLGGYYEYKVISLNDDKSGGIYPNVIENTLNQLGLEGWHLRCAYTNELGKNSHSGGLGGFSAGTNSTIDQNILIFERFVKISKD